MAIRTNLKFFQGEDILLQLTIVDDDGAAVDITGYTFTCTILANYGDATPVAGPYTIGSGITIIDAATGRVDVAIPDGDTDGLDAGPYVYDVKRSNEGAEAIEAYGAFELLPAATLT